MITTADVLEEMLGVTTPSANGAPAARAAEPAPAPTARTAAAPMNDRDALLRAIIESPDDDAPRLVYADWVDEHGDPDRAEFIRLQCELELIELGTPEAMARYSALSDRCHSLLNAHNKAWVAADLAAVPTSPHARFLFRRGMVHEAMCPVRNFVTHGDRLLDAAPIEVVGFRRVPAAQVRDLADCPGSRRTRGVRLHFQEASGPAVQALLAAWPFPAARTLDLSSTYVDRTCGATVGRTSRSPPPNARPCPVCAAYRSWRVGSEMSAGRHSRTRHIWVTWRSST